MTEHYSIVGLNSCQVRCNAMIHDKNELATFGGKPFSPRIVSPKPSIGEEEIQAITEVIRSGKLSSLAGDRTKQFEQELAKYLGTRYSAATNNGTSALHLALAALGINAGDEVIVSTFTFVSTASSVLHQDAIPIFADIERETFCIDPIDVRKKITRKTKAIIVVHLFGHPANLEEIIEIANERDLFIIEDCAQAIGAQYRGKKVGTFGHISSFSFYATKNITTGGEGGMIVTNDEQLYEKSKTIRNHGETSRYHHATLGYNYRMNEIQAAIGLVQLRKLETFNESRRMNAITYSSELQRIECLDLPSERAIAKHAWHLYSVLLDTETISTSRDRFVGYLRDEHVPVTVAYPVPLHLQPLFSDLYNNAKKLPFYAISNQSLGQCPVAEKIARQIFNLYVDPSLSKEDIITVAGAIKKVIKALT